MSTRGPSLGVPLAALALLVGCEDSSSNQTEIKPARSETIVMPAHFEAGAKPSYSESLGIFNAESQELDKLEKELSGLEMLHKARLDELTAQESEILDDEIRLRAKLESERDSAENTLQSYGLQGAGERARIKNTLERWNAGAKIEGLGPDAAGYILRYGDEAAKKRLASDAGAIGKRDLVDTGLNKDLPNANAKVAADFIGIRPSNEDLIEKVKSRRKTIDDLRRDEDGMFAKRESELKRKIAEQKQRVSKAEAAKNVAQPK